MSKKDATKALATEEQTPPLQAFESSVAELEGLVESLESGDIALEDALARFERGVTLARQCQAMLKSAELRVDQLMADQEQPSAFDRPDASDDTANPDR